MPRSSVVVGRLRELLLKRRWLIAAAAALMTIIVEMIEHHPSTWSDVDAAFLREFLIFGVLGPLFLGGTLSLLAQARSERTVAVTRVSQHRELSQQLARIQDWETLKTFIVEYPQRLVPAIGVSLYVYDQVNSSYDVAAEWWKANLDPRPAPALRQTPNFCGTCAVSHVTAAGHPLPLRCVDSMQLPGWGNRYCLPLMRGHLPIAFLFFYFPLNFVLSVEETNLLGGLAPAMAVAINDARPQRSAAIQAEAADLERKRIARDLHDTLGQSLAYLHLKLDQLSGDDVLREIGSIRQDLERMRDVANESYQKVRATLDDLRSGETPDLQTALSQRLQASASRFGFEVDVIATGQPRPLLWSVQRHILYIFREALTNVEKHSGAQQVRLYLAWTDDMLTIRLVDEGHGFDRDKVYANGHYGLAIMEERAGEVGGQLAVTSSPEAGTEVSFSLPLSPGCVVAQGSKP